MKKIIILFLCLAVLMCSCQFVSDFFEITKTVKNDTETVEAGGTVPESVSEPSLTETVATSNTETDTLEIETEINLFETENEEKDTDTETGSEPVNEKVFDFSIAPQDDGIPTVLIDPGHGFDDPGCTSKYLNGVYEKEITLKMANMIKKYLESAGCKVLFTHDGTIYPDEDLILETAVKYGFTFKRDKFTKNNIFYAYERIIYADILCIENDVDAFISVHANANPDSDTVSGFVIDYCAENDFSTESKKLSESLKKSLNNAFPDTYIEYFEDSWEDAYIVNKYVLMPSVLLEMGYTTTKSDAEKLMDDTWLEELASAVSKGITVYLGIG